MSNWFKYSYIVVLFLTNKGISQSYNFWQYTAQNGLSSSSIHCLHQASSGALWIGTDLGISVYDGISFTNYNVFDNIFSDNIKKISENKRTGEIWILHQNGGLSSYKNNKFYSHEHIYDTVIDIVYIDTSLFFLTTNYCFTLEGETAHKTSFKLQNNEHLNDIATHNNEPVVTTNMGNYYTINGAFMPVLTKQQKTSSIPPNISRYIIKDSILYGITPTGIQMLGITPQGTFTKLPFISTLSLTEKNTISAIIVDQENTLWIGTKQHGVLAIPSEKFPLIAHEYGKLNQVVSAQNNYFLVYNNQVRVLQPNLTTSLVYQNNNQSLTAYYKKTSGEQWIGTKNGLFITMPGTSITYSFKELRGHHITFIQDYKQGVLVGTNQSVFVYNPVTNTIVDFYALHQKSALPAHYAVKIKTDILVIHPKEIVKVQGNKVEQLFALNDSRLKNISFTNIAPAQNGSYWIATKEKGIIHYTAPNKYYFLDETIALPFKNISAVYQENPSILWCSSPSGIARINLNDKDFALYNQQYLVNSKFIEQQPLAVSPYVLFASRDGLVKLAPNRFNNPTSPEVYISSLYSNGKPAHTTHNITLPYQSTPITISYGANSLKQLVYYQYKLDGLQKSWSQIAKNRRVSFDNLAPGNYKFRVRAIHPFTKKTGQETSVSFTIDIPFVKTSLFYWLVGIGVFIAMLVFYFMRVIRLRIQRKRLKQLVEEKTFKLSVQKKHLEQLSYSLSHDLKNPVNNIKGLVEILQDTRTDEVVGMLNESTEVLENKIIATLNSIKKARANTKEIKQLYFDTIFGKVEKSLLMIIKETNANIKTDFLSKKIQYEESLLESILYNLVSNAIKYRQPNHLPTIEIITEPINEFIRLTVIDNGLGIDLTKDKDHIFSIFKRIHTNEEGTGIGLYMIKQMVELNGGSIEVESELGKGSTFHVYLKNLK